MKQILIYGDSLSWGIIPGTRQRFPFAQRWSGVFEHILLEQNKQIRVIENCLNGRRTVWDDPFKAGRNGAEGLAQVIEINSPLQLVILMLGVNDFQRAHENNDWLSAQGTGKLIEIIKSAPVEPGMPVPEILVVSPPTIISPTGDMKDKFNEAEKKFGQLNQELKQTAEQHACYYFDAEDVIKTSPIDGVHLDAAEHSLLGKAIANYVSEKIEI